MFTTPIHLLAPLDEDGNPTWETLEPLNYRSEKFQKNYVVPAGFQTDLASVPRVPLLWLAAGGTASAAAIVHDWLYKNGIKFRQVENKDEADEVFFEAMIDTGVPLWRSRAMYFAVKAFGGRFYVALLLVFFMAGCPSTFTPEMIEALSRDSASFCLQSDVRGGAGSIVAPTGGYGQATLIFCRTNRENSKLSVAGGVISIEHGMAAPTPLTIR